VEAVLLHHVSFAVGNLQRSATFYDSVLGALGHVRVWTSADAVGYGRPGGGDGLALRLRPAPLSIPGPGFHLAFAAPDRNSVALFHRLALRKGGTDNGPPGLRPDYGPDYYAAFVLDPDGYRIEAVVGAPA
jgi:catechol 2,3-dioxygenase-like lactoylglutathione lyase family enzyme